MFSFFGAADFPADGSDGADGAQEDHEVCVAKEKASDSDSEENLVMTCHRGEVDRVTEQPFEEGVWVGVHAEEGCLPHARTWTFLR